MPSFLLRNHDELSYDFLAMIIRRFRDLPEALLAQTILDSAGIESHLTDENLVRMDWFWSNLLGGVKLHVRDEDTGSALDLLDQAPVESFEVEGGGRFDRPRCPNCRALDIVFEELNKPVAFVSAYLGVPIPLHRKGWRCHSCGYQWEPQVTDA